MSWALLLTLAAPTSAPPPPDGPAVDAAPTATTAAPPAPAPAPTPPPAAAPPAAAPPPAYGYGQPPPGYYPAPAYGPYPAPRDPGPAPAAPRAKEPREPMQWLVRLDIGLGGSAGSEQKDLIEADGYSIGTMFYLGGSFDYLPSPFLGVGAFGGYADGGSTPDQGGPELNVEDFYAGGEVPLVLAGDAPIVGVIAPRLGIGWGSLDFAGGGSSKSQSGFLWGGAASLLFPDAHVGMSLVLLRCRVDPPGDVGRRYDLGGTFFTFTGVFNG